MEIRRTLIVKDTVSFEGGAPAIVPVTRVAACALVANPLAGVVTDDLQALIPFGADLGAYLVRAAMEALQAPSISYGKAAIVGTAGDIEHAAAIIHPRMGKPMREAIGGGQAIIPSNVKVAGAGASIDVPLGHKDDVWSFDEIDTLTITIPGAPRPEEIVVIVALANGGRPRPRVAKSGAVLPKRV
ncbi:MAG TPA: amino acid synthesis family protein [Pseudolabrys sp.]|nr:amino acid synthesis family protein [Pseudolabrys sp.]